jgi:hypothetical protein
LAVYLLEIVILDFENTFLPKSVSVWPLWFGMEIKRLKAA